MLKINEKTIVELAKKVKEGDKKAKEELRLVKKIIEGNPMLAQLV